MRRLQRAASFLASGVLLVAACQGGGGFPTGKWTTTNETGSVGVMEYRTDGTWSFTGSGEPVSSGTYSTDKDTITFLTDVYCKGEAADHEQGKYTWVHTNDQLTLKAQSDLCSGRTGVLDGRVWKPAQ